MVHVNASRWREVGLGQSQCEPSGANCNFQGHMGPRACFQSSQKSGFLWLPLSFILSSTLAIESTFEKYYDGKQDVPCCKVIGMSSSNLIVGAASCVCSPIDGLGVFVGAAPLSQHLCESSVWLPGRPRTKSQVRGQRSIPKVGSSAPPPSL